MRLPVNHVSRLELAARMLRERHRPLADWLVEGLQTYLHSDDDGMTLDRALGFVGALGRSQKTQYLQAERDRILRFALAEAGSLAELAQAIYTYTRVVPSVQKQRAAPSPDWTEVRRLVHRASRLGLRLPETERGLREALCRKRTGGCSVSRLNDLIHEASD